MFYKSGMSRKKLLSIRKEDLVSQKSGLEIRFAVCIQQIEENPGDSYL